MKAQRGASMKAKGIWIGVAIAGALALAACGGDGASEGAARGIVRGVDAEAGRVTLEHGDIPGMMKAMTMAFEVADPALLEGLESGDRVEFEVRYADGRYTVTAIEPR